MTAVPTTSPMPEAISQSFRARGQRLRWADSLKRANRDVCCRLGDGMNLLETSPLDPVKSKVCFQVSFIRCCGVQAM